MKDCQQLQILPQDEIQSTKTEIKQILKSLSKNELTSVRSMILPPMFTLNVLKIVGYMQDPTTSLENYGWPQIKKDMLLSPEIIYRRCESIRYNEFEEEEIMNLECFFQQVFGKFGEKIENKSELYGSFVHKMCKVCLRMRVVMHGSKFLRYED